MGARTVWQALVRPPWSFLLGAWPWRALAYLLVSAVLGLLLLPVTVLTLVLLPLWALPLGALERRRTGLLGFPRQRSGHVRLPRGERHTWLSVRMAEAATWRETAALLADLLFGVLALVLLVAEAAAVAVMVALTVRSVRSDAEVHLFGDVRLVLEPADAVWVVALGVALLALSGYLNAALAGSQASLLRLLCGPREQELARNVERLTRSRAALVAAFETERRRIERDLHDGVQQELVALAARLGLATLELDELGQDPRARAVRTAVEAAQQQAEHALSALRDTVRGIHPAVLTDHGLTAALGELSQRTPVPIRVEAAPGERLPAPLETAAYYLVTEAISNAAKHSDATRLSVRVARAPGEAVVVVEDDGRGGADEDRGTGLRGLRERAESLGGSFEVHSPPGGPTRLGMRLPLVEGGGAEDAPAAG